MFLQIYPLLASIALVLICLSFLSTTILQELVGYNAKLQKFGLICFGLALIHLCGFVILLIWDIHE